MLYHIMLCYIITYCHRFRADQTSRVLLHHSWSTANLRTKIPDFRGFDSSRLLILRLGILMSIGNYPEIQSQRILVARILVGRLGVSTKSRARSSSCESNLGVPACLVDETRCRQKRPLPERRSPRVDIHVRVLLSFQQPTLQTITKINYLSAAWSTFHLKHVIN